MTKKYVLAAVFAATAALGFAHPAYSQTTEEFYSNNALTMIAGYSPGGAYDTYARSMARYFGQYLPGTPDIVVQNMPGAGSLLLANHIANIAEPDGGTIGVINRGIPLEPLFGREEANFDPLGLNYIGSTDVDTPVCASRKDSDVQSIDDLFETELVVGASGAGSDTSVIPSYFAELLGMKFNVVRGYPGSSDYLLALERNEVQGVCMSFASIAQTEMYRNDELNLLFQASAAPANAVPEGTPVITDYVDDPDQLAMTRLLFIRASLGRPFIAPPDTPEERVEALREAFMATMQDPDFLAEMEQLDRPVDPTSGAELEKLVADAYAEAGPEVVSGLTTVLGRIAGEAIAQ